MNFSETIFLTTPGSGTVADLLRRAKQRLTNPKSWTGNGGEACVITAIVIDNPPPLQIHDACRHFCTAIRSPWPADLIDIYKWNDDPRRTHAQLMAAFDRAIELAK